MLFAKPENTRSTSLSRKGRGGFTIVELLVAAVIVLIAVFGVVAVVRKSADMQVVDYHRRQARAIMMRVFETTFNYNMFSGVDEKYSVTYTHIDSKNDTTTVTTVIDPNTTGQLDSVVLDERKGSPLKGRMWVTVVPKDTAIGTPSQTIRVHDITVIVTWREVGAYVDEADTLFKRLADAK